MNISFKTILFWICYAGYLYIIFPAAISKVIQRPHMMENMQLLGFNTTWTLAIGAAETIGAVMVLVGVFKPQFRTLGILLLFPFMIGALTAHMAHQEYHHYYNSLAMCFLSVILLFLDNKITIDLSGNKKE